MRSCDARDVKRALMTLEQYWDTFNDHRDFSLMKLEFFKDRELRQLRGRQGRRGSRKHAAREG